MNRVSWEFSFDLKCWQNVCCLRCFSAETRNLSLRVFKDLVWVVEVTRVCSRGRLKYLIIAADDFSSWEILQPTPQVLSFKPLTSVIVFSIFYVITYFAHEWFEMSLNYTISFARTYAKNFLAESVADNFQEENFIQSIYHNQQNTYNYNISLLELLVFLLITMIQHWLEKLYLINFKIK